ncbi:hypothetical protein [uncultured Clostridium sp.]|uniref:hypothetical protein n=1 Tax=uncultured Clostridium sp. TaxID=59620 RepID=UPI0028E5401D|nr:hypothetical protein [uncultured Clostridium sp.]
MLGELLRGIGIFYYWTWFIWPFAFVASFINAITSAVKKENSTGSIVVAGVLLLIILSGITLPFVE